LIHKVLITCPPMLKQINEFKETFKNLKFDVTAPEIIQTMSENELIKILPEHDGWIIGDDPATSQVFKAGKRGKLKAAVKWGIGTDNVDFDACKELNIPIINTPGMFGAEVADLAMCYLLGLARDAFFIDREVRTGNWPKPAGVSLSGKILGIVGLGDIGKNIAKRAHAHELNIIGWDPYVDSVPKYIKVFKNFPDHIENCDFLVFACALTKNNKHMFNESILEKIKTNCRLINVSRGPLIDESSLIKGLSSGILASAALDVFETEPINMNHEILNHPKCIIGSHNGSNTIDAVNRASYEAIKILNNMLENRIK
jgi:D-3-phosphoglycerate dehydrogenase